jgi:hypothetical protein
VQERRNVEADSEHSPAGLPLRMDPTSGALIGIFLLAACLAGPIGVVLAVLAWILIYASRRLRRHGGPQSSDSQPTGGDYAAWFEKLENDILEHR